MEADDLAAAVLEAGGRAEVRAAVGELYESLQAEVNRRRPLCVISGRCCRFDEYGHRLYVTTMELGAFMHDFRSLGKVNVTAQDGKSCPFQVGKLCGVHAIRPMGCRLFFCDASSTEWQQEQYEQFHARLKRLHESLAVPYVYMEWRSALTMLGFT